VENFAHIEPKYLAYREECEWHHKEYLKVIQRNAVKANKIGELQGEVRWEEFGKEGKEMELPKAKARAIRRAGVCMDISQKLPASAGPEKRTLYREALHDKWRWTPPPWCWPS
jgi:hypothetical protein